MAQKCNPGTTPGGMNKGTGPGAMPSKKSGTSQKHVSDNGNWNNGGGKGTLTKGK